VPWNFPICIWNLVEENSPHRQEFSSKHWFYQTADGLRAGEFSYLGTFLKQISNREDTRFLSETAVSFHSANSREEFCDFGWRDNGPKHCKAVLLHATDR
jgi:hypothetical protein